MGNTSSIIEESKRASVASDPESLKRKELTFPCKLLRRRRCSSAFVGPAELKKLQEMQNKAFSKSKTARQQQEMEQQRLHEEDVKEMLQAAELGELETVKELLEMGGLDVNSTDNKGVSALHRAAMCAREKVIRLLLERGADPNISDVNCGFTPLHWVIIKASPQMSSTDHVEESIIALYRGGCDLNGTDFNSNTALHLAAQKGNKLCVDTLVRLGARTDQKDILGRTCFEVAKNEETKELIERLTQIKETVIYHVLEISPSPPDSPPPLPPP